MSAPSLGTLQQVGLTALELGRRAEIIPVPLLEMGGELLGRIVAGEMSEPEQADILLALYDLGVDFAKLAKAPIPKAGDFGGYAPLPQPPSPLDPGVLAVLGQLALANIARARYYDPVDVAEIADVFAGAITGQAPLSDIQTAVKGSMSMAVNASTTWGIPVLPTGPGGAIRIDDFGIEGLYPVGWLLQFIQTPPEIQTQGSRRTGGAACCDGCESGGACEGETCATDQARAPDGSARYRMAPEGWECRWPDERPACFSQLFGPLR